MASAELQIPEHIQETQNITREELEMILHTQNPLVTEELRRRAQQTAKAIYGNKIYVRGLIEFTNYCKNNCYYCGIRCSNTDADRYRNLPASYHDLLIFLQITLKFSSRSGQSFLDCPFSYSKDLRNFPYTEFFNIVQNNRQAQFFLQ